MNFTRTGAHLRNSIRFRLFLFKRQVLFVQETWEIRAARNDIMEANEAAVLVYDWSR